MGVWRTNLRLPPLSHEFALTVDSEVIFLGPRAKLPHLKPMSLRCFGPGPNGLNLPGLPLVSTAILQHLLYYSLVHNANEGHGKFGRTRVLVTRPDNIAYVTCH